MFLGRRGLEQVLEGLDQALLVRLLLLVAQGAELLVELVAHLDDVLLLNGPGRAAELLGGVEVAAGTVFWKMSKQRLSTCKSSRFERAEGAVVSERSWSWVLGEREKVKVEYLWERLLAASWAETSPES